MREDPQTPRTLRCRLCTCKVVSAGRNAISMLCDDCANRPDSRTPAEPSRRLQGLAGRAVRLERLHQVMVDVDVLAAPAPSRSRSPWSRPSASTRSGAVVQLDEAIVRRLRAPLEELGYTLILIRPGGAEPTLHSA